MKQLNYSDTGKNGQTYANFYQIFKTNIDLLKKVIKSQAILIIFGLLALAGCEKDKNHSGLPVDGDGNEYDTVAIGTQTWLKENLKTTKYKNGDPVYLVTDNDKWSTWQYGAYCWYDNDPQYKDIYGGLYNWKAVSSDFICPEGWHVPTRADWSELINYLGGSSYAGDKIKETGTEHWITQSQRTTNETGFTALPGGIRYVDGTYEGIRQHGCWWMAEYNRFTTIISSTERIGEGDLGGNIGCSVRCIKDK